MEEDTARQQSLVPASALLPDQGLLIDLGRQSRSRIKRLKRGRGRLVRQITQAVTEACVGLGVDSQAEVVPVVILYRRRGNEYRVWFGSD